ncbi:hypothetical protein N656DRAFT_782879 [Canariomyces notabilis]|uniref:Uncharacterized protein n=1 Tax=Canariomyces notabilis TaxID=2074819 RepID=A0AAN6QHA2_9PEZI|nr:hypothetical protein N656DRAFT_782879 [Canariomyces arenarius]
MYRKGGGIQLVDSGIGTDKLGTSRRNCEPTPHASSSPLSGPTCLLCSPSRQALLSGKGSCGHGSAFQDLEASIHQE